MKYWRGYLTAAVFAAITWGLMQLGTQFTTLVDMIYPYVIRTLQTMLAQWSSGVDFVLWQVLAVVFGLLALASLVLMIVLKWNPVQWFGWILAVCSGVFMLNTLVFGLIHYAGPLAEDIRLDVVEYNVDELTEAAIYYRDKANELAKQVNRDASGNVQFSEFHVLAEQAGDGFEAMVYDRSFPVFAGSRLPVKELGWADLYTNLGITGVTVGITGESAVNPQIPDVILPFTMAHEMAHRMCIATETDASFASILTCVANESIEYRYSGYFVAYRYCYNALASSHIQNASAAAARVSAGVSDELYRDMANYDKFFTGVGGSGSESGTDAGFGTMCDLLVSWHIQEVVLPSISVVEERFDPMDESQVDLTGIVNAGAVG